MKPNKASQRKALREGLNPLLEHFGKTLTEKMPSELLKDGYPTVTFVISREGVSTQATIKPCINKDGVCGYWSPKECAGSCP